MNNIPIGLCQCGCGNETTIAKCTDKSKNWIKGTPVKFIQGHNNSGIHHNKWNGGKSYHSKGYLLILCKNHPKANSNGYVPEHLLLAEKALGKPLPLNAVVHHADGSLTGPLVICQDAKYHKILHQRLNAYRNCGHANWLKCWICQKYDKPENLTIQKKSMFHKKCSNERRARNRLKSALAEGKEG